VYYIIAALLFQGIIVFWIAKQIGRSRSMIVHAHDFNTIVGCAAATYLFRNRIRLLYDCHELTPGVYLEWYGSMVSAVVRRLEKAALRSVDAVVAANDAIHDYLHCHSCAPAEVIYTCPSMADVPDIKPLEARRRLGLSGFVVLFSGRVRQDYDLDMVLEAARQLARKHLLDFRFVFTGPTDSMRSLMNTVSNEGLQGMFHFRGWVSEEDLLLYYLASNLCFAVTRNLGPNTAILTPIKLFESMACGVPAIVRDKTLAARLIRQWRCGIVLDIVHVTFFDELIRLRQDRRLLADLGEAGRRAFRLEYNWQVMQIRLLRVYTELSSSL
jgi:glycosyltransferase involved in cell wall biosynthesis